MLSGEADANDTYVEGHSGAGGTESQDWANMLLRMYNRWAERQGNKVALLEVRDGEEAGNQTATIHRKGKKGCGWMQTQLHVPRAGRTERGREVEGKRGGGRGEA